MVPTTGRTIRKVLPRVGGGGVGEFLSSRNFCPFQIPCMNFFRPWHEYFLGLIGVHDFFFHLIFPCANFFFYTSHPPPPFPP